MILFLLEKKLEKLYDRKMSQNQKHELTSRAKNSHAAEHPRKPNDLYCASLQRGLSFKHSVYNVFEVLLDL